MQKVDFESIMYFRPKEITDTGATLGSVQLMLIQHLDNFRAILGCPVRLIKNGLTTGRHASKMHVNGLAADVTMDTIEPNAVLRAALEAYFRGIGFYARNSKWVSVHLDLRPEYAFWRGVKHGNETAWRYLPLVEIPK